MKIYQLITLNLTTLFFCSCSVTAGKRVEFKSLPTKDSQQVINSKYDIRKHGDVTANELDNLFKGKLAGKGAKVIEVSKRHGICPRFYAALLCWESAYGTSLYSRSYNNVAGRMAKGGKTPMKFKSIDECLELSAAHLSKNYIGEGRTSLTSIQAKYCPTTGKVNNDSRNLNKFWLDNPKWKVWEE